MAAGDVSAADKAWLRAQAAAKSAALAQEARIRAESAARAAALSQQDVSSKTTRIETALRQANTAKSAAEDAADAAQQALERIEGIVGPSAELALREYLDVLASLDASNMQDAIVKLFDLASSGGTGDLDFTNPNNSALA